MSVPHNLRVYADLDHPEQWGTCDRCGFLRFLVRHLLFQWDQRGNSVQNIGLRVCIDRCYDEVATILRPIIIPGPEGVGNPNPRPTNYAAKMAQNQGPTLPFSPSAAMLPIETPISGVDIDQPNGPKQLYQQGYPGI